MERSIAILLTLFFLLPGLPRNADSQEERRKGGFGRLFKPRQGDPGGGISPESAALRAIAQHAIPADRPYREILTEAIVLAYERKNYGNLWNHRRIPSRLFRDLSRQIRSHGLSGILPLDPASVASITRGAPVNNRDLNYTIALADAGCLVRLGAVPRSSLWPDWDSGDTPGVNHDTPESIAADLLEAASQKDFDVGYLLDAMAPKNGIYRSLKTEANSLEILISRFNQLPRIPNVSSGSLPGPGDSYPFAPVLAEVLAAWGFLDIAPADRGGMTSLNPALTRALTDFQRSRGLRPDGVLGPETWRYLNESPADRYRSALINLNRARLLPDSFGKRYLIVNIPSAKLYGYGAGGREELTLRVVHGKTSEDEQFHTPIFRDVMREIVFFPYWNVPKSISVTEIYPKLLENPGFLQESGYEIVDGFRSDATIFPPSEANFARVGEGRLFLRQRPTPGNALGKVKFLLPNQFNVYLHDTPSKHFFDAADRAQSHGCVRVSTPERLAAWVLKDQGWDPGKVAGAMRSGTRSAIAVKNPVNVYLTYLTLFPEASGTSADRFFLAPARDVYTLDPRDTRTLRDVIPTMR